MYCIGSESLDRTVLFVETGNPEKTMDALQEQYSAVKTDYDAMIKNTLAIIGEKREILAVLRDFENENKRLRNQIARLTGQLENANKQLSAIRNNLAVRVLLAFRRVTKKLKTALAGQREAAHRKGGPGDG